MEVVEMKLDELNIAEYNPRTPLYPGSPDYEKLKRSIDEFGLVDPLIWNKRTQTLVGGHQRLQVMKDMGITEAHVSVVDVDEDREKALNLVLNRVQGDWDLEKLRQLEQSTDADILALGGFEEGDISEMWRLEQLDSATSFLSDPSLTGGGYGPDGLDENGMQRPTRAGPGAAELKDDHPHRTGQQFHEVALVLTRDQREVYFEAIHTAKRVNSFDNSMDAIVAVCLYYNEHHQ